MGRNTSALLVLLFCVYLFVGIGWRPHLLEVYADDYQAALFVSAALGPAADVSPDARRAREFVGRYEALRESNFLTAFYHCYQLRTF